MAVQNEVAKKRLAEAVTYLEATGKHAAEGVKSSGKEFQTAVRQTIADARAAAQKVSEAVAAKRTAPNPLSARESRRGRMRNYIAVVFDDTSKAYEGLHAIWQTRR